MSCILVKTAKIPADRKKWSLFEAFCVHMEYICLNGHVCIIMLLCNYPLVPTILLLCVLRSRSFISEATKPAGSLSDHTNHIFVVGATSGSTGGLRVCVEDIWFWLNTDRRCSNMAAVSSHVPAAVMRRSYPRYTDMYSMYTCGYQVIYSTTSGGT